MSLNRIQKLLLSEYCDFEDVILVESPFAQTDRDGKGLRQVNLGLTPTKLIMAADVVNSNKRKDCRIFRDLDADIVDFELISVFPLQYARVSIFHRRRKCTIKVKFCTNKVWYFELGGTEKRQTIWRTWCDRINYINRNDQNSASETSAGSSSTASTTSHINNLSSIKRKPSSNKVQIWCTFDKTGCNIRPKTWKKWTDKYLFIGHNFEEFPLDYTPIVYFPTKCQLLCSRKTERSDYSKQCDCDNTDFCMSKFAHRINRFGCGMPDNEKGKRKKLPSDFTQEKSFRVNRFGKGIDEKCLPGLYLPTESFIKAKKLHQTVSKHS
ncbi:uncharacterized protein LOC108740412 isoform X2 [Agrilus planipennis]|uniref:Uncharacterized protein LOC108740412 isoform X2 n=1 Tax=Agrilus planipennis TaxID=224129 RepID=A0A1W4X2A9_AGRPL|nr:uncharacterized protein LOC108740412 isoform X2 [Agrilus planipennis]